MPIKTQSAKAKGRRLQGNVREKILKRYPELEPDDIKSCSMGAGGVDVQLSPKAQRVVKLSLECKKQKKTPSVAEVRQARANMYPDTLPGVVWCPHGKGPDKALIMFDLEEFLQAWSKHEQG